MSLDHILNLSMNLTTGTQFRLKDGKKLDHTVNQSMRISTGKPAEKYRLQENWRKKNKTLKSDLQTHFYIMMNIHNTASNHKRWITSIR